MFFLQNYPSGKPHITKHIGEMKCLCGSKVHLGSIIDLILEESKITEENCCKCCVSVLNKDGKWKRGFWKELK